MDNDGEIFRTRANDADRIIDLMIKFLESKGLYNEYMNWKESQQ
jgi:hypothetical protein